jgi:phosphopantothenoylcysteine decarboxylase
MNILVGATGSVASIKLWMLCNKMLGAGNVRVVLTERARFLTEKANDDPVYPSYSIYYDEDEWKWEGIGDTVLHIHLKDWADVLVVAPLSANTLAKMTHGICDNLLTSIYRASYSKTIEET